MINKDAPVICAECKYATVRSPNLFCEKKNRTVYNAKPAWCPFPLYGKDSDSKQITFLASEEKNEK